MYKHWKNSIVEDESLYNTKKTNNRSALSFHTTKCARNAAMKKQNNPCDHLPQCVQQPLLVTSYRPSLERWCASSASRISRCWLEFLLFNVEGRSEETMIPLVSVRNVSPLFLQLKISEFRWIMERRFRLSPTRWNRFQHWYRPNHRIRLIQPSDDRWVERVFLVLLVDGRPNCS